MPFLLRKDDLWEVQSFSLRRVFDLQFESIWLLLREYIRTLPDSGLAVDFGSGRSPFRSKFPPGWRYVTVDAFSQADYSSLGELPEDVRADCMLMTEVLEHLPDPVSVLAEARQRIADRGRLIVTVPFNARVHGAPNDFRRWTPAGLEQLLADAGWRIERVAPRGNDLATLAAKLIFACSRRLAKLTTVLPALFTLAIFGLPLLLLAQASLHLDLGEKDDPLGYFLLARKA